jgi:O-antigen/teichoic acid export membrane protein
MTATQPQPATDPVQHPRRIEGKAIGRGMISNFVATVVPSLIAIFAVRVLVKDLGPSRFGVLSLAWSFIGAIGLLDLGIGRALTHFLAVRAEIDERRESAVVWTSLAALFLIGTAVAVVGWMVSEPVARLFVHDDWSLLAETARALRVMSISIPLVLLSSGLQGILEAFSRFELRNAIVIPLAILNLLVPVVLLKFGAKLPTMLAGLVVVRLLATGFFLLASVQVLTSMRVLRLTRSGVRAVFSFGGWVTVSNVIGPLFMQFERFCLGTFTALAAVAFYSTPFDILSRVTALPGAALNVLFPALSQAVAHEPERAPRLVSRGQLIVLGIAFPAFLLLAAIAPEALRLWLGADFSDHSSGAARLLAASIFVNCMAWVPFSLLQAAGRVDLTAKLHLAEIPAYLAITALFVRIGGVDGCALANLLRSAVDAGLVVWLARRVLPATATVLWRASVLAIAGSLAIFCTALPIHLWGRLAWSAFAISAIAVVTWRWLLDQGERGTVRWMLAFLWPLRRSG